MLIILLFLVGSFDSVFLLYCFNAMIKTCIILMSADLYKVYVDLVLHTVIDAGIGAVVGSIAASL